MARSPGGFSAFDAFSADGVLQRLRSIGEEIANEVQQLVERTARQVQAETSAKYPSPFQTVNLVQLGKYWFRVSNANRRVNFFDTNKTSNARKTAAGRNRGALKRFTPTVMVPTAQAARRNMLEQLRAIAERDREV